MYPSRLGLPSPLRPGLRCALGRSARPRRLLAFSLLFIATGAAALPAQERGGSLIGVVRDAGGSVVAGAHVVVPGTAAGALSGPGGRYLLRDVPPGERRVEVHHIGYRSALLDVEFREDVVTARDVHLEVDAVPIPGVEVTAVRAPTPQLAAFFARRERGSGHYFTRADIDRIQAWQVSDVLRRVPGARLVPISGPYGTIQVLQLSRTQGVSGSETCPILYLMDGVRFPVRTDVGIDAFVRADEVAAVEVYSGTSRVPAQFGVSGSNARCGVVAIWTLAGEGRGGR